MIILILLVLLWTPILMAKPLRALHSRAGQARRTSAERPSNAGIDTASQDRPAWNALDDRQLTRLLIDSAPRLPTE